MKTKFSEGDQYFQKISVWGTNIFSKTFGPRTTYIRSTGTTVNTAVVIACAEGILMHEDAPLLTIVNLSKGWAQYLLQRMGYVKWKATSKAKVSVENFAEIYKGRFSVINQACNCNG